MCDPLYYIGYILINPKSDIETLNLCFSGLKSLDKISKLKCLKRLYLRHNEIDNFQEIKKLRKISSLSSLSLIGNPICQLENYRYKNW